MEILLGLSPLQVAVEKETRQAAYRLHCSNKFKNWGHSAIFKVATEDLPVSLAPSDRMLPLEVYLIRNIRRTIPLGRYGYLKLKHGFLPMA
jgi:hypothetical protein